MVRRDTTIFSSAFQVALTSNDVISPQCPPGVYCIHSSQPATPAGYRENIVTCTSTTIDQAMPPTSTFRPSSKIQCISVDAPRWKSDQTNNVAASTMRYQICPRLCHRMTSAVLRVCSQWLCHNRYRIAPYHRHKQKLQCNR
jgi:hypothetical protein